MISALEPLWVGQIVITGSTRGFADQDGGDDGSCLSPATPTTWCQLLLVLVLVVVVVVDLRELLSLLRVMVVRSGTICAIPRVVPRNRQSGAFCRDELKCLVKVTQRGVLSARVVRILVITAIGPLVDHDFPFRIRRWWFRRRG